MCTFNLEIDDKLVDTARSVFPNDETMTLWLENQLTNFLGKVSVPHDEAKDRKSRRHDALRGILKEISDVDCKSVYLKEKYGI